MMIKRRYGSFVHKKSRFFNHGFNLQLLSQSVKKWFSRTFDVIKRVNGRFLDNDNGCAIDEIAVDVGWR
jgi:hypothetical protein